MERSQRIGLLVAAAVVAVVAVVLISNGDDDDSSSTDSTVQTTTTGGSTTTPDKPAAPLSVTITVSCGFQADSSTPGRRKPLPAGWKSAALA